MQKMLFNSCTQPKSRENFDDLEEVKIESPKTNTNKNSAYSDKFYEEAILKLTSVEKIQKGGTASKVRSS